VLSQKFIEGMDDDHMQAVGTLLQDILEEENDDDDDKDIDSDDSVVEIRKKHKHE